MMRLRLPLLALATLTAGGAACTESATGLDEATYVEVVAQLTWSRVRYLDTPRDDSLRAAILAEYGVTAQDLVEFAEHNGEDVERMERIWEAVRQRVETLDDAPEAESRDGMLRLDSLDGAAGER